MPDPDEPHTAPVSAVLTRLGDVEVRDFMTTDWHRNARVFRQAIPDFQPICEIDALLDLALDPDVETRLIQQTDNQWSLERGPLDRLPQRTDPRWTVLLQGLNLHLQSGSDLLERFRFVPEARLDDLMISFATDGGGVGPHFDSYDVFLLQMHGQRRWRISAQSDLSVQEGLPLKILKNFRAEQEFTLNPGDMLYLPPHYAHDGIAIGECTTLSIGFRAPTAAELLSSVFQQLAEDVLCDSALTSIRFADPLRGMTDNPGALPTDLSDFVAAALMTFKPDTASLEKGLLIHTTEPKESVVFDPPSRAPTARKLLATLKKQGIHLHRASRLVCGLHHFAINGEVFASFNGPEDILLRKLANHRFLSARDCANLGPEDEFVLWCVNMADAGWLS